MKMATLLTTAGSVQRYRCEHRVLGVQSRNLVFHRLLLVSGNNKHVLVSFIGLTHCHLERMEDQRG